MKKDDKYWQSRCSKFRSELLNRKTEAELKFEKMLQKAEITYIPQKGFFAKGRTCIVDFYLPKYKLCVELDGLYHTIEGQTEQDMIRDMYLTDIRKFAVLRIPNELAEEEYIIENIKNKLYKRGQRVLTLGGN